MVSKSSRKLTTDDLAQSKERLRQEIMKAIEESKRKLKEYENKHGKIKNPLIDAAKDPNYPFAIE